jgi:hypothetical protein
VGFRDFAQLVDSALQREDIKFFRQRAQTEHVVCRPEDVQVAGPAKPCERTGDEYEGLNLVYWRSDQEGKARIDTVLMMIEGLWTQAIAGASDKFGGGQARVYALGGPGHTTIVTAITTREVRQGDMLSTIPRRAVLVIHWRLVDGDWRFFRVDHAFAQAEDFLEPTDAGRRALEFWEPF